ncbi:MAG: ABC transporter ATP-binding protein [bacterium]|nr:ABC transporter ATP-binding protein [bacterium]
MSTALSVRELRHYYGERMALNGVSFEVAAGEIFGLLGPNGGGKTTLFRILTTLMRPSGGTAEIFGLSPQRDAAAVRRRIGVVFQHPSVDPKLKVIENLIHHGHLFGLRGKALRAAAEGLLERFGLADRAGELTETLSGGLQRRVELAKALLPEPDILFLDEPSTGLDPAARRDFGDEIGRLRADRGTTVVLTTHILEEADRCDRVGILNEGNLVALGEPEALKKKIGGEVVAIESPDAGALQEKIKSRFGIESTRVDGTLRIEQTGAHEMIPRVIEAFPGEVKSLTFGRPTLEDVFIHETGRRFWQEEDAEGEGRK